jgi:ribosomal protein S18 acetylase RimI-like enzyme
MLVRQLNPDSATALRELRCLVDVEGTLGRLAERAQALKTERIREQLCSPYETFGAFVDENLVGSASLSLMSECPIEPDREIWFALSAVMVHPDFRSQGIGRALVKQCISRAAEQRPNGMLLVVNVPNPAKALYESLGFESWNVEEGTYEHNGQSRDQISMRLRLNAA